MKETIVLSLLFLCSLNLKAQELHKKSVYHLGAGPAVEGDLGMWAIQFTNQFGYYLNNRVSLNPSLSYFSSLGNIENLHMDEKEFRQNSSSSLFANVKLQIDILKTQNDFRVGLAAGPAFQLGGTSYHRGFTMDTDNNIVSMGYEVEKHRRLGYVTELIVDWPKVHSDRRGSAAVSMSSFSGYWPYYLMATYRLGFQLR